MREGGTVNEYPLPPAKSEEKTGEGVEESQVATESARHAPDNVENKSALEDATQEKATEDEEGDDSSFEYSSDGTLNYSKD